MRGPIASLFVFLLVLGVTAAGPQAAEKILVVATIPDFKALAEEVGGSLVEVEALARGTQNAHELEVRPSLMLKLRRADVLIENGLELDSWADVAVQGANNPRIIRGAPGRVDVSRGVRVLDVPTSRVDRSMGDVHPLGNPHYSMDPGMAPIVTQNLVEGLARFAPEHRATFHPQWIYLLTRFGLTQAATLEDRPGIPASPAHLTRVIRQMKEEQIKVIVVEPWNDVRLARRVAQEAGATAVVLASMVGGVKGADSYIAAIDYNVSALAQALR